MATNSQGDWSPVLEPRWRFSLAGLGLLAILISLVLYWIPPNREDKDTTSTIEHAYTKAATVKTTLRPADPTSFCLSLFGSGVLALFVAANGLRLVKVSKEGGDFAVPTPAQVDKAVRNAKELPTETLKLQVAAPDLPSPAPEPTAGETVGTKKVYQPKEIPVQVIADFFAGFPDSVETVDDIAYGVREQGKGNFPWFIHLKSGDTFKVSYGGQGKRGATPKQE